MPSRIENLRDSLKQLEAELVTGQPLDPSVRSSLEQAAEEIRELLSRNRPQDSPPESLLDRLQTEERAFEASHPQLTQVLARIVDALGQMGI